MSAKWFCDVTGKEVYISPKSEPVLDANGKPVMTTLKLQDARGRVTTVSVPKVKYLEEKGYLVRIAIGDETIQRVLSEEALIPLKAQLKAVWDTLELAAQK